ncbi:hypothetical protein FRC12_005403 [Ceratobasidium sp. 428]|nr:hypothetical protein FRC12_005403 [Ceratobasidium sp. 428]
MSIAHLPLPADSPRYFLNLPINPFPPQFRLRPEAQSSAATTNSFLPTSDAQALIGQIHAARPSPSVQTDKCLASSMDAVRTRALRVAVVYASRGVSAHRIELD